MILEFTAGAFAQFQRFAGAIPLGLNWSAAASTTPTVGGGVCADFALVPRVRATAGLEPSVRATAGLEPSVRATVAVEAC